MRHETSTLFLLSDSTQGIVNGEGHVIDLIKKSIDENKDVALINAQQAPITVRSMSEENRVAEPKGTLFEVTEQYMSKGNINVVVFLNEPDKESVHLRALMTWINVVEWP